MLFPITIFPCVLFASDIFLINESAKTESSCPLVFFVSTPTLQFWDCLLWHKNPERASHLICIPKSLFYRISTVPAGSGLGVQQRPHSHSCMVTGSLLECVDLQSPDGTTHSLSCFSPQSSALEKEGREDRSLWYFLPLNIKYLWVDDSPAVVLRLDWTVESTLRTQSWASPIPLRDDPLQVAPQ